MPGERLKILLTDIFRATLAEDSGNEGYIGIAPDASSYHVVVPVDRQLARGLSPMAKPANGTPFGGYNGWYYFCCLTHTASKADPKMNMAKRIEKTRENAWLLQKWAKGLGLAVEIIDDLSEGLQ